jgi:hypothetical protein
VTNLAGFKPRLKNKTSVKVVIVFYARSFAGTARSVPADFASGVIRTMLQIHALGFSVPVIVTRIHETT